MAYTPRINRLKSRLSLTSGFALPTILIASIVMLTMLLVGVTSTSTTRVALQSQYYEQLAKAAGDAGIAYAEACLDKNGGAPLWTDANPLKPSTDCSGITLAGVVCPDGVNTFYTVSTPAICSVNVNNNVRSSFSINRPALDTNGNATTIPNSGFVELIRASTGAVWRSYKQAASQPAVAPALCSGATSQALGWAVPSIIGASAFPDTAAVAISIGGGSLNPGSVYFRKDFNVTKAGTYTINTLGDDESQVFIDGKYVASNTGFASVGTATTTLTVGCHTLQVNVKNTNFVTNGSSLKFSLKLSGSSIPLVVSDTSWRVSAGNSSHYSSSNYFQASNGWGPVRQIQSWIATTPVWTGVVTPAWNTTGGNNSAWWISTTHSYSATATYPASSTVNFRPAHDIVLAAKTDVKLSYACDDSCNIYIDGNQVASTSAGWATLSTTTLTLSEGTHSVGISLTNGGAGASGLVFAIVDSTGKTLTDTNAGTWLAATSWNGTDQNPFSYDDTFAPNPNLATNPVNLLVVGGGGGGGRNGGGGGGGGAVQQLTGYKLTPGEYTVTVGAGGAKAAGNTLPGTNGGFSQFDIIFSIGGGGGGSRDDGPGGLTGGSGGGGAGAGNGGGTNGAIATRHTAGAGILTLGNAGGNGTAADLGVAAAGGGGGGAGGVGTNAASNVSGNGGAAFTSTISGASVGYGGGGGGGPTSTGTFGTAGSGAGASNANGTANRGGGGSGGSTAGSGGSGVVIISYVTGSMTASGGTITTSGGNTIHTFTSSGTFTITSIP